jgi:hypothetical protein
MTIKARKIVSTGFEINIPSNNILVLPANLVAQSADSAVLSARLEA